MLGTVKEIKLDISLNRCVSLAVVSFPPKVANINRPLMRQIYAIRQTNDKHVVRLDVFGMSFSVEMCADISFMFTPLCDI